MKSQRIVRLRMQQSWARRQAASYAWECEMRRQPQAAVDADNVSYGTLEEAIALANAWAARKGGA